MKKSLLLSTLCVTVISLCVAVPAKALLMKRLDGAAAYDTVLDITWVTDASLGSDNNWYVQVAWAEGLNYLGFDDWRLPSVSVSAGLPTGKAISPIRCDLATEMQCRDNELGYMFYYNLGGSRGYNITGDQTVDGVNLRNIMNYYWSGTEYDWEKDRNFAWAFNFAGTQSREFKGSFDDNIPGWGWAVRDGDVATSVPEPTIVLLLATGLIGLVGLARIRSA